MLADEQLESSHLMSPKVLLILVFLADVHAVREHDFA